jgi:predicted GNAT family N-acyltransferase
VRIELVDHDWPRFGEVLDLYYDVLYGPFGVARETEWYHPAHGSRFAIALSEDGALLGSARLLPSAGDAERQVRQVVVSPEAQGRGTGRALMEAIERIAAEEGARELWLNASSVAYGFYEALGWEFVGEEFASELTRVPHRLMRKR